MVRKLVYNLKEKRICVFICFSCVPIFFFFFLLCMSVVRRFPMRTLPVEHASLVKEAFCQYMSGLTEYSRQFGFWEAGLVLCCDGR